MSTTKSQFKDNKDEQYYNPFRDYTAQNTKTPPNSPVKKFPPKAHSLWSFRKTCRNRAPNENLPSQKSGEIPTFHVAFIPSKNPHHTKTSQMICNANQLTGSLKRRAPTEKHFQRLISALRPLNNLSQITEASTSDRQPVLHITYLIDVIFAKFAWAVFRIPKFNFCCKFLECCSKSWCFKRSSFNVILSSVDIS